jgi:hypothetical protein
MNQNPNSIGIVTTLRQNKYGHDNEFLSRE